MMFGTQEPGEITGRSYLYTDDNLQTFLEDECTAEEARVNATAWAMENRLETVYVWELMERGTIPLVDVEWLEDYRGKKAE
jgi:hypothetical protein